jgi:hypothetical protein
MAGSGGPGHRCPRVGPQPYGLGHGGQWEQCQEYESELVRRRRPPRTEERGERGRGAQRQRAKATPTPVASGWTVLESALVVLVRSAVMLAKPISTVTIATSGVPGPSRPHRRNSAVVAAPFTSSTVRKPKRRVFRHASMLTSV